MKFGEKLSERSVLQWRSYNIDYSQIKGLIKESTTPGFGKAVSIPGRGEQHTQELDNQLFALLQSECQHVSLFVRSKCYEVDSRLAACTRRIDQLERRRASPRQNLERALKLRQRYAKLETETLKVCEEIENLSRFITTNSVAVRKLVKKYRKWSGSALAPRVDKEILNQPDCFATTDLKPARAKAATLLQKVRAPFAEEKPTPEPESSPELGFSSSSTLLASSSSPTISSAGEPAVKFKEQRKSGQVEAGYKSDLQKAGYWNEYDYPQSDDGNDGFVIYVDPDAPWFPGQKALQRWYTNLRNLTRKTTSDEEAGLSHKASNTSLNASSSSDADDEAIAIRKPLIPRRRYNPNYGALPTHASTHAYRTADPTSPQPSTLCLLAAALLLVTSTFLTFTSRKKLRSEVDVAVVLGVLATLAFAVVGILRWWTVERYFHGDLMDNYRRDLERHLQDGSMSKRIRDSLRTVTSRVSDVVRVSVFIALCIASGGLLFVAFH